MNFAYIEFIMYNKTNMKLSIERVDEWNTDEWKLLFFNGQKLKRLVQWGDQEIEVTEKTISYFILYILLIRLLTLSSEETDLDYLIHLRRLVNNTP